MSVQPLSFLRMMRAQFSYRPLGAVFNILLLAVGIAVILTVFHLNDRMDKKIADDLQGIDLVISGKGSPLQIILANVFHIDIPTGNIPLDEANKIVTGPLIKSAIPLAYGDNYNGYRIVGTTPAYIAHYNGEIVRGKIFSHEMEAVIGSEIAHKYALRIGDKIVGAHGLTDSHDMHTNAPYIVVGILKPTGRVIDRLVLTPVESIWHVHEMPEEEEHEHEHEEEEHIEGREITAFLLSYKSPMAAVQLPRLINQNGSMQAASPAFEMARLNKLMGTGGDVLAAFGVLLIGFAAFGVFISFFNAVTERQYDIALLRALGATRSHIFLLIMTEVAMMGIAGAALGGILTHVLLYGVMSWIYAEKHIFLGVTPVMGVTEICVMFAAIVISLMAGLIPALKAMRVQIIKTLVRI